MLKTRRNQSIPAHLASWSHSKKHCSSRSSSNVSRGSRSALYALLCCRWTSPPSLAKRTLSQGAVPSKALCVLICLSIEWACMYASASRRKLRLRQATTDASFVPSYLALIGTGVSSSTWIKRWSIFWWARKRCWNWWVREPSISARWQMTQGEQPWLWQSQVRVRSFCWRSFLRRNMTGALHKRSSQCTQQPTIVAVRMPRG